MVLMRATIGRLEVEHIDPNFIAPAGQAWQPCRRDLSDYLISMGWFAALNATQRSVLFQRSLDPPYSFRAIGQRGSKTGEWARRQYKRALVAACTIANRAGGDHG
jgi:hypothetical protein